MKPRMRAASLETARRMVSDIGVARVRSNAFKAGEAETPVEIGRARSDQLVRLVVEEVVGPADDRLLDDDALLRLQLGDESLDVLQRRDAVGIAVHDQPGGGAGRQEGEVKAIGWRGD